MVMRMDKDRLLHELRPFVYAGTRIHLKPDRIGMTAFDRACYRMHLQVAGTVSIHYPDGSRLQARPGSCYILNPNVPISCSHSVHYIRVAFDLFDRDRFLDKGVWRMRSRAKQTSLADILGIAEQDYIPSDLQYYARETAEILARTAPRDPGSMLRGNARLGLFIAACIDAHRLRSEGRDELEFHLRVERLIQEEAMRGLTIQGLAQKLGLHPSHLTRRYKAATGVGPKVFLSRVRLERAQELLRTTDNELVDIAEECGFPSPAAMRDVFRKGLGMSPTAWRESVLGGKR